VNLCVPYPEFTVKFINRPHLHVERAMRITFDLRSAAKNPTQWWIQLIDYVRKHTDQKGKVNVRLPQITVFINETLLKPYIEKKVWACIRLVR